MPIPQEQLASALQALQSAQQDGVVRANALSRPHRERLLQSGFVQEVIKGWLIVAHPSLSDGSSTGWYASFWAFVRQYLDSRFGNGYCLSAEASLKRHARSLLIPRQVTVILREGSNQTVPLPFDTSLLLYKDAANFPANRVQQQEYQQQEYQQQEYQQQGEEQQPEQDQPKGLWLMDLPLALVRVAPSFFQTSPEDAQIALRLLRDPAPLLRVLLETGSVSAAGRLAGACEVLGDVAAKERIVQAMRAAGYGVRVSNPFERTLPAWEGGHTVSPHAVRLRSLWATFRAEAARIVPPPPGLPADPAAYLAQVDERYGSDAYNSLSIEGYRVTPELIERVRQGAWNPDHFAGDRQQQDALAARGYFQAFGSVKESLTRVLAGADAAHVVARDHPTWYQELFAPAVQTGLLPRSSLAGYRNQNVYLRGSRHVPPAPAAVLDSLDALFEPAFGRERASDPGDPGALLLRVHPPVQRRQRASGAVPDELPAGGRRLSLDDHSSGQAPRLPGRTGDGVGRAYHCPLRSLRLRGDGERARAVGESASVAVLIAIQCLSSLKAYRSLS